MPRHESASERLALNIRRILAERDMTQEDLAALIGKKQSAVSQILSHKRSTPVTTLDAIVSELNIDPSDLFRHPSQISSEPEAQLLRRPSGIGQDAPQSARSVPSEDPHAAIALNDLDARLRRLDDVAHRQEQTATSLDAALDHLRAILDEYNDLAAAFVNAPPDQQSATARTLQPSEHRVPRKSHKSPRGKARR